MDQRASNSEKYLTSDKNPGRDTLSSILDHTAEADDVYDGTSCDEVFVPLSVHDDERDDDRGDG